MDELVWMTALRVDELWAGEMIGLHLGHTDVLLVNVGDGEVHAYANRCPHAGARLSDGRLTRATLRCSAHLWEFDARSGDGINPRNCKLQRYPVKVVDGDILVQVSRPPALP